MENHQLLDQTILMQSDDEAELRKLFIHFERDLSDRVILSKLLKKGYEESEAIQMILEARNLYKGVVLKKKAQKDIIVGGLWFLGGIIGTFANIGFIFWGAIVFGFIQGCRGIFNYRNNL
jgi:hypothetical protein